jgi:hypothetical protein
VHTLVSAERLQLLVGRFDDRHQGDQVTKR